MYSLLLNGISIILLTLPYCCHLSRNIRVYEYGIHLKGEIVVFDTSGQIEPFLYEYKVNATYEKTGLAKSFSYLRVEYQSPMSDVNVSYNPSADEIVFKIQYPLMQTIYAARGYTVEVENKSK